MKKKLLGVLIALAMLIPGIIAIADYTYLKNTPIELRNISRLEITDPAGDVFDLVKGQDGDREISRFVKMNKNAVKKDSLPESVSANTPFTLKFHSYSLESDCKYYFSLSADEAYYVNGNNDVFKIAESDASSFLCSYFARSLYSGAAVPSLNLSDKNPVVPATVKWTFRDVKNEYIDYSASYNTTKAVNTYELSSDFGMKFSVEPDFFHITVSQDGTTLYDGDYESVSVGTVNPEKTAHVEIKAEWYEALDRSYAGSLTYSFDANLVPPPSFGLKFSDGDYVENGGLVILTGKNIKNPAEISVSCSPAIDYTPKWFSDEQSGSVYAIMPIPCDTKVSGDKIVFSINAGGTEITLDCPYKQVRYETLSNLRESSFESDFANVTAGIADPADGTVYFDGAFANPVSTMSGLKGFGRTVDGAYRHNGVDFTEVKSGETVSAGAAGKVVYVGNISSGQATVVIEHGLGLRSWYVGLATVNADIEVGSEINAGGTIGTCLGGSGLHCSITVFGVPVSPYKFWTRYAEHTEFLKLK